jgi:hypothetical protein
MKIYKFRIARSPVTRNAGRIVNKRQLFACQTVK